MSNIKRTNTIRSLRVAALAILTIGFAATASFPAAAHVVARHQKADLYFNQPDSNRRGISAASYPPPDSGSYPPPDYCDLPSAGCESYLSN